jgi:hypothetical protein
MQILDIYIILASMILTNSLLYYWFNMIQRYFREELPPIGNGETKHSRPPCLWKSRTMVTPPQRRTWTLQIYWWSNVFFTIFFTVFYTVFFTDLERSTVLHLSSLNFLYCKNRRHNCSISVRLVSNTDHNEWLRFVWILIPAVLLQIFKYSFFPPCELRTGDSSLSCQDKITSKAKAAPVPQYPST